MCNHSLFPANSEIRGKGEAGFALAKSTCRAAFGFQTSNTENLTNPLFKPLFRTHSPSIRATAMRIFNSGTEAGTRLQTQ